MKHTLRVQSGLYVRCNRCWTPIKLNGRLYAEGEFLCRECRGDIALVEVDPYRKPSTLARWEEA